MAGAKPGVHVVKLKPIEVPEALQKGNKFIKWDDDSTMGIPVTLKVDSKGYILYWRDQNKWEMDCLDVALIRDTRTGKNAKVPKDGKLRDTVTMGVPDVPLEDKMITIAYGTDMTNINFVNFAANSRDVAREWTRELFQYATNLLRLNASPLEFLEKCYTKLSLVLSTDGKIPVKNIMRMFAQHKDDRKRVEKALESANLPAGRNDLIFPSKFTWEDFLRFYRFLTTRQEVERIFHELGATKKPYLTAEQFVSFLNTEQRDPRLNEILYPYYDVKRAQDIIDAFEPNRHLANKESETPPGHLSQEGFLRYLMSVENALIAPEILDLSEDMDQPLAHYFINSSHNTYLTGHQLTGKSSVEIYRQSLLTGCRCVELDCWDGKGTDEEPIITHGFTMCTEIPFKEVIEAIAESAFKVSEYPVILSFENHCSPKQQAKMAAHCRNILGDALVIDPLDTSPPEPGVPLPSPETLKRKILIKNKKRHVHKSKKNQTANTEANEEDNKTEEEEKPSTAEEEAPESGPAEEATAPEEGEVVAKGPVGGGVTASQDVDEDDLSSDSDLDSDVEEEKAKDKDEKDGDGMGTAGQEAEAGMEMSALVNYIQPVHFHSFELADKRDRAYECSSFVETQATNLLKEQPVEFVNFNKRQVSRIYPKGTRVDSSNYMPQIFWNAGCQLVALNFQTLDLAMMLNLGIFEYNARSGYVLKPDFMRRTDRHFDPFAESTVDGIVANTVEIRVIAGQFLSDKKVGTYVEVDMYGLPADTVRKKFKTKTIPGNGISPIYDEEPFVFKKVVLPNLATLRMGAYDDSGKLLGHRVLPVEGIRPGYRHITLRNEMNQPQNLASLFCHIRVKDYVPDAFADFAAALANPIAHQYALDKHAEQLAVLEEDFAAPDEEEAAEAEQEAIAAAASPAKAPFESEISRKRNASVMSKKSATESSTPALSRVGSTHVSTSKADASASQGSAGSGLAGPKTSSSLPSSPMHAISNTENGAVRPTTPKIDVAQTTRLKDPDVLEPASVEQLKAMKQYVKLAQKFEKDLDTLRKKHEKARNSMQEFHELQEEKLLLSQMKSKTTVEKVQRKSMKRASKRGDHQDIEKQNKRELGQILAEHEMKHRELKQSQVTAVIELSKEQYKAEHDLCLKYHPLLYDTLENMMDASQSGQMKKLDDIHDKEVGELKKKLDAQNREEMKSLAKKHRDKNELARVKREAQQKHIQMAVHERQKLQDILKKRKDEVTERHEELKKELTDERAAKKGEHEKEYENKLSKIAEEEKQRQKKLKQEEDEMNAPVELVQKPQPEENKVKVEEKNPEPSTEPKPEENSGDSAGESKSDEKVVKENGTNDNVTENKHQEAPQSGADKTEAEFVHTADEVTKIDD